jgi:hypothetical protein
MVDPNDVPAGVLIGAQTLKDSAVGETIEERFKAVITPQLLSSHGWLLYHEADLFKMAVGAVLLSYPEGSIERERIQTELKQLGKLSAIVHAAKVGLAVDPEGLLPDVAGEAAKPIGFLALWRERQK